MIQWCGHLPAAHVRRAAYGLLLISVAALTGSTLTSGAISAVSQLARGGGAPSAAVAVDYALSAATAALAVAALRNPPTWPAHVLGVALLAAAAGFNSHALAAVTTVAAATTSPAAAAVFELLPAAGAALMLLAAPAAVLSTATAGRPPPAGQPNRRALVVRAGVVATAIAAAALLPPVAVGVLFLGAVIPASLAVLLGGWRHPSLATARARSRSLLSLLTGSLVVLAALAAATAVAWLLTRADPRAPAFAGPLTLLLWVAQITTIALAVVLLTDRGGSSRVEHRVTRAVAVAIVAALSTASFVLVSHAAALILDPRPPIRDLALGLVATLPVAVAFLPLYTATAAALDRVLYGTRPTPYSVLAGITATSRADPADAPDLNRLVQDLAAGLGAARCRLTVRRPGLPDRSYRWPPPAAGHTLDGHPRDRERDVEVEIRHGDDVVGSLAVDDAALGGLQQQRRHELLDDVADSLGVVLQASRAGIALELQLRAAITYANDIVTARRAMVAAMDRERRRIERDLHDGVQHHLSSLRLTLGLVDHQILTRQVESARKRLDQLVEGLDVAEAVLAETAQGVSSPQLAELGLVQALRAEIDGGDRAPIIDAAADLDDAALPPPIAAASFYCCLEAVGNARKHSPSATVEVRLWRDRDRLRFSVVDDGIGWDTTSTPNPQGRGLRNVAARMAAVGGHVEISSIPGHGTTVEASVPLPDLAELGHDEALSATEPADRPAAAPTREPARVPASNFLARVSEALRTAREHYHRTEYAPWLRILAERLEGPPHVAVRTTPAPVATPANANRTTADHPATAQFLDGALAAALRHRCPSWRFLVLPTSNPAHAPGVSDAAAGAAAVLAVVPALADGQSAAYAAAAADSSKPPSPALRDGVTIDSRTISVFDCSADPVNPPGLALPDDTAPGRFAAAVSVDVRLAWAALTLDSEQLDALRQLAEQQQPFPGLDTHRAASGETTQHLNDEDDAAAVVRRAGLTLIRTGRAQLDDLSQYLTTLSGIDRLIALLEARVAEGWDAAAARSVLIELEELVGTDPPAEGAEQLRWRLERIRATSHELTELEVVEQLRGGGLQVPDQYRQAVLRLLGGAGDDPRTRLGLPDDAEPDQITAAADQQRARWQQLAAHPATTRALRWLAEHAAHTCTQLHAAEYS